MFNGKSFYARFFNEKLTTTWENEYDSMANLNQCKYIGRPSGVYIRYFPFNQSLHIGVAFSGKRILEPIARTKLIRSEFFDMITKNREFELFLEDCYSENLYKRMIHNDI